MDASAWAELDALFEQALELEPAALRAFLKEVRLHHPQHAQRLEALLRADSAQDSALDEPVIALPVALEPSARVDEVMGSWRVLRPLGEGGMGQVFLVERVGKGFEQRGALKLLREDRAYHAGFVERFRAERQFLAKLSDHEHIAAILDGGVTQRGEPFLVMEYIDGEALDVWADGRRLELAGRLALFVQLCDAVAHLHQRLIIHRDLKPSNVLVWQQGQVKLLDFGIAKALAPWDGLDYQETRTADRALTPAWASTEQLKGEPLTTASDVYALGLILYMLLVGELPWSLEGKSWSALIQAREQLPAIPTRHLKRLDASSLEAIAASRRSSPSRYAYGLAGDLDAIVERALRPEPQARYASAADLAQDVRAYLEGREVLARRGVWWYGALRAARRYRVALLIMALIVGFAGVYAWTAQQQAARLAHERDLAQREADKSRRLASFLEKMISAANPASGEKRDLTVREILDESVPLFEAELEGAPEERAALEVVLAKAYRNLGMWERADALLAHSLQYYRDAALTSQPGALRASLELSFLKFNQGDVEASERILLETWERSERACLAFAPEDSARKDACATLAAASEALGYSYLYHAKDQDPAKAKALFERALALYRELEGEESLNQLSAWRGLASAEQISGRSEEALAQYEALLALQRRKMSAQHPELGATLHLLSYAHPEPAQRLALREQTLKIYQATYGERSGYAADLLNDIAMELEFQGRIDDCVAYMRRAIEIYESLLQEGNHRLTLAIRNLGAVLLEAGRLSEAEPLLLRAYASKGSDLYWGKLSSLKHLSALYLDQGRAAEALVLSDEAQALLREQEGASHVQQASILSAQRALILAALGRWDDAGKEAARASEDASLAPAYKVALAARFARRAVDAASRP